jgi:hypothetical protein
MAGYDLLPGQGIQFTTDPTAKTTTLSAKAVTHDPAGNYTITDTDGYTHIVNSATGTIALPTLADNYNRIITIVRDVADSTTPLIIDGEGAETINGNASEYLYGLGATISLMASQSAAEWIYIGTPYDPYYIEYSSTSNIALTGTSGLWQNPASHQITVQPGKWEVYFSVGLDTIFTAATQIALRANASQTSAVLDNINADIKLFKNQERVIDILKSNIPEIYTLTASSVIYLNVQAEGLGAFSTFQTRGTDAATLLRATRIF